MSEDAYKISTSLITVIVTLALCVGLVLFGSGCAPPQEEPAVFRWNVTEDGRVQYRFIGDGSIVIQYAAREYFIQRTDRRGEVGPIEWEWEDDGDIDIEVGGREYDLDSPFDYVSDNDDDFGAAEFTAGAVAGALIGKKSKKKPLAATAQTNKTLAAENAAMKAKLARQKEELRRQQAANAAKKKSSVRKTTTKRK